MKLAQDKTPALLSNAGGQVVDIQIGKSREANAMILNVLTNMIYTNKPMAVWREYGCNAADAHIEAGRSDIPIEITLPSRMSAEAVIRDFGYGMTEGKMLDVYCMAGESTKRDTNEQTGTIGIGAKAGYAYGEMFTVTSWNGGTKTVYQFFKEAGVPRMMKVEQVESNAPDGTEIRVPVRAADLETFKIAAERTFRYFRVPPIVHGGTLEYKRGHQVFKGNDWALTGDMKPVAIMGNVGYEIDDESMDLPYDSPVRSLLEIGIEIHFTIGELEIAASREALQYKDDTKKAIADKAKRIITELAAIFKVQISTAPNLWEAKKAYAEAFERLGSGEKQTLRELIDDKVIYNGVKMESGRFDLETPDEHKEFISVVSFDKNRRGGVRRSRYNCDSVLASDNITIALNDLPKQNIPQSRARGFFNKNPNAYEFVVLTFKSEKAKKAFWKHNQMDGVPTVPLSSIAPLLTANGGSYAPSAHRSKHSSRAFVLDEQSALSKYNCKTRSAWWAVEQVDRQKDKGVYVVVRGFKVENPQSGYDALEPDNFLADVRLLRARGLIKGKLYAFKRDKDGKLPKLGAGWVPLKQHIENEVADWIAKYSQQIADYEETVRVSALLPWALASRIPDCIAKQCIEERERMNHKAGITLADFIRGAQCSGEWVPKSLLKLPDASVNLREMQEKVIEKYPMLTYFEDSMRQRGEKALTALSEYIKLVEQQ